MPPSPPSPPLFRQRWFELSAIVGFWLLLSALALVRRLLDPRGDLTFSYATLTLAENLLWACLTPGIFAVARRYPLERSTWITSLALHLALAVAAASFVDVFSRLIYPLVTERAGRRAPPLEAILRLQFLDEFIVYLAVLFAGFARDYFVRFRERQAEAAHLQAQLADARLSALRMQLNPHFLFNTLHAISALVERDPAGVRRIVARLSGLLRHVLEGSAAQEIPLRDELAFLRSYLDIQQVRFQGRLAVTEEVAEEALDALVPNLILQPLVENAVEHGAGRVESVGRIALRAHRAGDTLHLVVADNGPGLAPSPSGQAPGVGLRNTRARLEALYGAAATLHLETAPEGGVAAHLALPYHTAADLRAQGAAAP